MMVTLLMDSMAVTIIFIFLVIFNAFLASKEFKFDWLKISTKKISVYMSILVVVIFSVILIQQTDISSDFLVDLTNDYVDISRLYFNTVVDYLPGSIVILYILYPLLSYGESLLFRLANIFIFILMQYVVYNISTLVIEKNQRRTDFKIGFLLFFSSSFVILNVVLVENIDLWITLFVLVGIYLILKNHSFLGGMIFGFLATVEFTCLLYFLGLMIYFGKRNSIFRSRKFSAGGISVMAIIFLVFLTILGTFGWQYLLGTFVWQFLPSSTSNLNFPGIIIRLLLNFGYFPPFNILFIPVYAVLVKKAKNLYSGSPNIKQLVDIFLLCTFFDVELSFLKITMILALISVGVLHSRSTIKGFYGILNILVFLDTLLIFIQSTLKSNIALSFMLDLIVNLFLIMKAVYINYYFIKVIKLPGTIRTGMILKPVPILA